MALLSLCVSACSPDPTAPSSVQPQAATLDRIVFPSDRQPSRVGGDLPIHSLLNIGTRLRYGQFVWNERDVPAGQIWIRVDLRRQLMSVFRGGDEIGSTVILYGADKKPTPRGRFPVLARLKDHRSSLYNAAMPYTLRLTGDGVAIHGSNVRRGAATHGCIGVPTAFAAHLFEVVQVGDIVTIA